ncbi:unnamed protein product [Lepeophtheirus salmonis]|uniref:(salmon louse) hypothetical protein n=1 Tax=Lepeophtheirus salmonis TaxID=72036 RepID=A0A7R8HB22_LEPSM|nr:unnamed protein product [Lepeophtheirus salmonis]CAF2984880.1 unnamed protein product [Lepeophtheirus salmonis]
MPPFSAPFCLLQLCGDVESNPGPRGRPEKPDPVKLMETKMEEQEQKIEGMNEIIKGQEEIIKDLQNKQVVAEERIEKLQVELQDRIKEIKVRFVHVRDFALCVQFIFIHIVYV